MPLNLNRGMGDAIRIRVGEVHVWVRISRDDVPIAERVRLVIDAPPDVEIVREELLPPGEQQATGSRRRVHRPRRSR
jgi:sRNA-binding carbon storage regulator CsrA